MSAHCNPWLHSPLKTVLNKLGDSYQTYANTYKTHAMATHQGGTEEPLDRDSTPHEHSTDALSNHSHEDMDNFKNVENENHTTLKAMTRNLEICYTELRLPKVNLWKL